MRTLEAVNPLMPAPFDIVWSIVALVLLAFMASAIVSIVRANAALTGIQVIVWFAVVIVAPVVGAIAWFVAGHPRTHRQPTG